MSLWTSVQWLLYPCRLVDWSWTCFCSKDHKREDTNIWCMHSLLWIICPYYFHSLPPSLSPTVIFHSSWDGCRFLSPPEPLLLPHLHVLFKIQDVSPLQFVSIFILSCVPASSHTCWGSSLQHWAGRTESTMKTNVNSTIYFSVLFYFLLIFLVCKYLLLFSQLCEFIFKARWQLASLHSLRDVLLGSICLFVACLHTARQLLYPHYSPARVMTTKLLLPTHSIKM